MLKVTSQLFSAFQNRSPSAQQKCLSARKPGSSSDVWIQFERNFITDGSDSVHALEFYHLFSRGYEAPILRFVLRNLCRQIGPASLACWWQDRLVWLDKSKSLIYTGGHNSYRTVQAWLKVVRPRNQTNTVWVTMVRQARAPRFEIARFSNKEKNQSL